MNCAALHLVQRGGESVGRLKIQECSMLK
jgi:hypothetical protein